MRERANFVSVRPYLAHALVATVGVVGLPIVTVFGLIAIAKPDPNFLVLALVGLFTSMIATGIGLALWKTRPESGDIAFGELLIWG